MIPPTYSRALRCFVGAIADDIEAFITTGFTSNERTLIRPPRLWAITGGTGRFWRPRLLSVVE